MKHLKKTLCLLLAVMMLLALAKDAMAGDRATPRARSRSMPSTSRIRRCART